MNVLENMLQVETEARKIVEDAQKEANAIRKNARDDAKAFVTEGKQAVRERLQQEIAQLEKDADAQRTRILSEAQQRREALEQQAVKQLDRAVENVMNLLLEKKGGNQDS